MLYDGQPTASGARFSVKGDVVIYSPARDDTGMRYDGTLWRRSIVGHGKPANMVLQ